MFPCKSNKINNGQHKFGALHRVNPETYIQSCRYCAGIQTTTIKDGQAESVINYPKADQGLLTRKSMLDSLKSHDIDSETGDIELDPGT